MLKQSFKVWIEQSIVAKTTDEWIEVIIAKDMQVFGDNKEDVFNEIHTSNRNIDI